MPPLPLALTFRALLPGLSPEVNAVLGALVASNGATMNAHTMARRVGLRTRFQLDRRLRHDGLPNFGELADWVAVLTVLRETEATDGSLLAVATRTGLEPATCYRRCRRTLGVPWRLARDRGFAWGLVLFLERCTQKRARARAPDIVPSPAPASHRTEAAVLPRRSRPRGPAAPSTHPQGVVAFRIPVPDAPTDVAVSPAGAIYVTRAYAAAIARIDFERRRIARSIPVGSNPTRLALGGDHTAFVTNQFGGSVSVIDLSTDTRIADIAVPGDPAPLVVGPDGRTLYVCTNHDMLCAVGIKTRRVLRQIPLPATSHHLALHPRAPRLYVSTRTAGSVIEFELPSLRETRTFETGGQTQALAVAPDGSELYVADEAGAVHVINLDTGAPAASLHFPGGAYGLDLTPDGAQLYVAIPADGRVHILDRATRRLVHTVVTEGSPRHTAFAADGRTALIVNERGWVTVVW
ncbi:MAG TPA: YncE family protein [Gemmatimonadales bacterium]|jgi:YVTN family beta-propeller protein|nr:YncE family protein [Gemmatimonadales bacterium]